MIQRLAAAAIAWLALIPSAQAFEPKPAEIGLQPAASDSMVRLISFHTDLVWVISAIVAVVFVLLLIVCVRFNAKANPVPSKTTHHVMLEVAWTILPVVILVLIAIPSYKLLYYLDRTAEPDMTLKVSGYQWGWTYTYPDYKDIEFNADIILDAKDMNTYIPDGKGRRLLETYNPIVLPVEKNIQVLTTASDVIHAWTIPALGAKKDAVPGRTNEMWFRATEPGIYYGQCSEICGINHASMPISAYLVPFDEFEAWTACMNDGGEESKADFPARACVQKLGFDKYRSQQKAHTVAQQTTSTGASE